MPRKARTKSTTGIYHVVIRGVNRQTIFEDEEDKVQFLQTIAKYKGNNRFILYGYCLMDNHIHLLLKEKDDTLSVLMKRISSSYVYWYNRKYRRCGHLFQERFNSENVENTTYFRTVLRYIHQNPLKAGLVTNIFKSKWTSIHEYVDGKSIVDTDFPLRLFSNDLGEALRIFIEYMQQVNEDKCLDVFEDVRLSDDEVRAYMKEWGILHSSQLQSMAKESRDAILVRLRKLDGVSIRQLSRITGISKSVIQRAVQ